MNRTTIKIAIAINLLALIALLGYSLERTAWLFQLFEADQTLPVVAAVVVELAAISLLVGAGAIAQLDAKARAWSNRALGAVLSVQALANLSAGYLRGGHATLALFQGEAPDATYAVAAALWLSVNLAVPALIFFLSKLLERLIAAWQSASDLPLREVVTSLREEAAKGAEMLASAVADLAYARETEAGLRERLTSTAATAANEGSTARELRERLAKSEATAANRSEEIGLLREHLQQAREEVDGLRELTPTRDRIVAYARSELAKGSRSLSDIAREVGFNESSLRSMLKTAANGHLEEEEAS
jgi:methylphosphotriester-DNA--protein-cysteine methyltransferase